MIAKKVARRTDSKSSMGTLVRYVLREGDQAANDSLEYQKVTNCSFDNPSLAVIEIEATQSQNTRSKSDKTYHLVVSFRAGERPEDSVLSDIEHELCKSIGYEEHQRISVLHRDTDNTHLHIAINKVHPETLNNIEVIRDFYRLDEACQAMEQKHHLEIDNRIDRSDVAHKIPTNGNDQAIDIHGGIKSFKSWLYEAFKNGLADELKEAVNWDDFHATLARSGLEIKPYNKGLVIGSINEKVFTKASEFVDDFGQHKIEQKLGLFQEASDSILMTKPSKAVYQKGPVHHNVNQILWNHYEKTQLESTVKKRELFDDIKLRKLDDVSALKGRFTTLRGEVKESRVMSKHQKWTLYQDLHHEKSTQLKTVNEKYKDEIAAMHKEHPRRGWQDFLVDEALSGDVVALKTLRSRAARKSKGSQENGASGSANVVGLRDMKPVRVMANGDSLYDVKGITVRDNGSAILVDKSNLASVELVLRLGIEKYGSALTVQGSQYFQTTIVQVASDHNIDVTFKNPDLAQRKRLLDRLKEHVKSKEDTIIPPNKDKPEDARANEGGIEAWISARNRVRSSTADTKPYVLFGPEKRGEYRYGGCRKVGNEFVALYESKERIVVVPASVKQQQFLKQFRIGEKMDLDQRGFSKEQGQDLGR